LVSQYPPVDDYEFRLAKPFVFPKGNKTTVNTILFVNSTYEKSIGRISEILNREVSFPIQEEYTEEEVEILKKSALHHAIKMAREETAIFTYGKPYLTYFFILLQIVIFFWMELHGGSTNTSTLIKYGAKVNQLILEGQWWRFFTPIFIHIGFLHLAMNTFALYFLGTTVERMYGNVRFLFIYLFAGACGFIASFLFSANISAGASGAIFGCFGALLYFGAIYPKLFFRTMGKNLFIILGLNLVVGFSSSGTDNAGHIGGLLGGFLAAGIVCFPKKKKLGLQLLFLMGSIVIVLGALLYGFKGSASSVNEKSMIILVQNYIDQNDYDQAYETIQAYVKKSNHPSERTYLMLAFVELKKNMFQEAKNHLNMAVKLNPKMSEAYYYLAIVNLNEKDAKQAKINADKAVKIKPDDKDYLKLQQQINQYLQSSGGGG
jgi:rhomboid protease GluP